MLWRSNSHFWRDGFRSFDRLHLFLSYASACVCQLPLTMPPAAQQLAELADDVLMQLATLLAIQASSESCAALSALCSTCSAFRRLANEAHAWEHAASALGLAPAMPPSAVLAVCRADDIFRAHSAEPCEGLHVAMLPRDGGWARRLLDELQPSGLCVTAELDDSNVHVTRTAPFARSPGYSYSDVREALSSPVSRRVRGRGRALDFRARNIQPPRSR